MALDKVLSASLANAAVNASAISNTANLVIGALNTGNTIITGTANVSSTLGVAGTLSAGNTTITGNAAANTLSLSVVGGQGTNPLQVAISGNGSYMRISSVMAADVTSNGSIIHLMGKANTQNNSGYIGYLHSADSSSNNAITTGLYGTDHVLSVTGRGSVGINTVAPIPHNGNNALVVKGVGARGIIELWEGSGVGGKAVFQQVDGDTYIGNLAKGSGNGKLILLANGTGTSAAEAMTINANSHITTPYQPAFVSYVSTNVEPTTNTKLPYDTLHANNGSHFSTSTNTFTSPIAGFYIFNWRAWFKQGYTGTMIVYLYLNGSIYTESRFNAPTVNADYDTKHLTWTVKLSAGDYVSMYGYSSSGALHTSNSIRYSEFSGYLLG